MPLRENLDADLKVSMKARDQLRMDTIRNIKTAVMNEEIRGAGTSLDDAGIQKVITGLVKQRRDSIALFKTGGRQDLVEKEERELVILQSFLPKQLTADELEVLVVSAIQETGATDMKAMGQVIKAVQAKAAGAAEGRAISELVKRKLAGG